jgi:hypothetical protein
MSFFKIMIDSINGPLIALKYLNCLVLIGLVRPWLLAKMD